MGDHKMNLYVIVRWAKIGRWPATCQVHKVKYIEHNLCKWKSHGDHIILVQQIYHSNLSVFLTIELKLSHQALQKTPHCFIMTTARPHTGLSHYSLFHIAYINCCVIQRSYGVYQKSKGGSHQLFLRERMSSHLSTLNSTSNNFSS